MHGINGADILSKHDGTPLCSPIEAAELARCMRGEWWLEWFVAPVCTVALRAVSWDRVQRLLALSPFPVDRVECGLCGGDRGPEVVAVLPALPLAECLELSLGLGEPVVGGVVLSSEVVMFRREKTVGCGRRVCVCECERLGGGACERVRGAFRRCASVVWSDRVPSSALLAQRGRTYGSP